MYGSIIATLLVSGVAHAGSWEPGAMQPLPVDGSVHTVEIADFGGETSIVLAGPDGVRILAPDGSERAAQERSVSDLVVEDLDNDGTSEVLVCGPDGLEVLRAGDGGFGEPIELSGEPCTRVDALAGDLYASLVTLHEGAVTVWTPGGDGLVAADFAGPKGVKAVSAQGPRFAVWSDVAVVTGPEPSSLEVEDGIVAVGPDGSGWAVAYGGEDARLVLADGTEVPMPASPTFIRRLSLGGPNDLLVGLGGQSVAQRVGDGALELLELPVPVDVVGSGDLDDDGCADLVAISADGSEASVVKGVCEGSLAEAAAAGAPLAVPVDGQPPPSGKTMTLAMADTWSQIDVTAGRRSTWQLQDAVSGWTGFSSRGGPTGFSLTSAGALSYTPTSGQVGLWRVAIRVTNGTEERWTGIVLRVNANPDTPKKREPGAEGAFVPVEEDEPAEIEREPTVRAERKGFFAIQECLVGAGLAAGVSRNGQASWSNVGLPDAVASGSPAVTLSCGFGAEKGGWFLGADSAPTFFYLTRNGRNNHVLAATLGVEWRPGKLRIGPYVNAGLLVFGFGLRTVFVPFETKRGGKSGVELRLTGYPENLAGQAMLAYTWEFGGF